MTHPSIDGGPKYGTWAKLDWKRNSVPGRPVECGPLGDEPELYRNMDCPRYDACLDLIIRGREESDNLPGYAGSNMNSRDEDLDSWACYGCLLSDGTPEPPPALTRKQKQQACIICGADSYGPKERWRTYCTECQDEHTARRVLVKNEVVRLNKQGTPQTEIAKICGLAERTVRKFIQEAK